MANVAVTFRNTTAIGIRAAEVPDASFANGMNNATCMPGIGVATDNPDLAPSLPEWTLEDQFEVARIPQVGQLIGGTGVTPEVDYPSSGGVEGNGSDQAQFLIGGGNPTNAEVEGDPDLAGTITVLGTANLQSLATGWELL
jgi:hypothetical protein